MIDSPLTIVDKRRNWEARVEMSVLKLPKEVLSTYDKLMYTILCGHASSDGDAGVYIKTIAAEASCSDRQVRYSLARLASCGLLARKPQYRSDSGQTFNIYEVYGFDNYSPPDPRTRKDASDTQSLPDCGEESALTDARAPDAGDAVPPLHDVQSPPCTECSTPLHSVQGIYEQHLENINTYSPTESAESTETQPQPVDVSEIPAVMLPTVKYFLHETGRTSIDPSELIPLRALEQEHYPTRVNQEIDTAVARFRRSGRDPALLKIDYLYESLRHQPGRRPKQARASPAEKKREREAREANLAWEREQQEELVRRFGGDWNADGE
jgi:hypothetical protein